MQNISGCTVIKNDLSGPAQYCWECSKAAAVTPENNSNTAYLCQC